MTASTTGSRPGPAGDWAVERVAFADTRVQALVTEVQAYYVQIYGGPDDSPVDPTEFDPPLGHFLLGLLDGSPVAMGGWRRRPELDELVGGRCAEVKRMFVSPTLRRRGLARLLLTALEDSARDADVEVLALETGSVQTEAIALYESAGYQPTARFGHYADSELARYYAKRL
ncbi:Acetyltransferase (GNAT) family protein [Pedococcus dokdonensis]|uniref:Acetyltransferase (GNAT) family protein n=1 Tax=Pedococcus dokdonensis TaxID=443156 RepID=A0A1H0NES3_9MICO|nr:GNAT family N-acetyltransferase [Pedococcus dokdonensis]SDO91153.1 Acetyltransferase (GNAT) family protein [Pedococcus dokdonensis]